MIEEKCFKCKKRTNIMIKCSCNKLFCIKHYTPTKHNCPKSLENDKKSIEAIDLIATGSFKKIDKI